MWQRIFIFITIFNGLSSVYSEDDVITTTRGQSVTLICPLDVKACGELHSVKWFKGNDRIAVVSGDGEVANVEGELQGRLSIDHSPVGPATRLHIKTLDVSDDDTYLCESTYLEPLESCDATGAYNIKLNIHVPPSTIVMLDEAGHLIRNGTKLGPLREGQTLTRTCEAIGARPAPTIGWYRGKQRIPDSASVEEHNGLFTVKSTFSIMLSRAEVQGHIECLVDTPALENKLVSNHLLLDMQVRPIKIELTGVEHHVVQGTKVLLQCDVSGARPAANVTWYNNSQPVYDNKGLSISTKVDEKGDGTFSTISQMIFTATRFENGVSMRCEADNIVMRQEVERPLHDTLVLEVMYPPVVSVRPDNITVNETQDFLLFCEYDANPASLVRVTWTRNDEILNINRSRYEGGNPEQTALLVKGAHRSDIGSYSCELQNTIGADTSDNVINVDVQYVPIVEITMEPDSPLIENNESNVTLYCNVLQGNPSTLQKVRWFLDGQLLKELPECEYDENDEDSLCEVDPSKMLLQNVGRDFHGNYSCEGYNAAGWGDVSNEAELIVFYEPGNASLTYYPPIPVKRKSVTFTCSVEDGGNPPATRYRWLRGGKPVMDVVTSSWTVDPVGLDSRTNFSCYAYNEGGEGHSAAVLLDVHAPPAFIQKLHPYTGALFSAKTATLSCRIECVPACTVSWFKDGAGIEENDSRYTVKETLLSADPSTGDFESVQSVLHFNITAWPNEKLDIFKDNANYSCVSTNNSVGTGVRSTTFFGVEYPPENTTVSNAEVQVEEGQYAPRIMCSAKAYPEPSYIWIRNGEIIAKTNALIMNKPMQHADGGIYICIAKNKHGNHSAETNINILFKPNCTITRKEVDDEDTLVCTAFGNPERVDFGWSVKAENETYEVMNEREHDFVSYVTLDEDFIETRTYRCIANNTVGMGTYCEIDVAGHLAWWQKWDKTTLYILVGALILLLVIVIIVCLIIICICRNRRKRDKYQTDLSIDSHQSILTPQATPQQPPSVAHTATVSSTPNQPPATDDAPKSPPKWPLRPGVMVHVKEDTKEQLQQVRTQSPTRAPIKQLSSSLSSSTTAATVPSSPQQPATETTPAKVAASTDMAPNLPPKNAGAKTNPPPTPMNPFRVSGCDSNSVSNIQNNINETSKSSNDEQLVKFTNSKLLQRILTKLKLRRTNVKEVSEEEADEEDDLEAADGSSFKRRNDYRFRIQSRATWRSNWDTWAWFGSNKSTRSNKTLVDNNNHIKGIECTEKFVTYKRPPVPNHPINAKEPEVTTITNTATSTESGNHKKDHDKLYAPGGLTEPGEYENLPFHGLQNAPSKSAYLATTNSNTNVVRVAPRQKYQTSTNNHSNSSNTIASSIKSGTTPSSYHPAASTQFPIQSFNYINYQSQPLPNCISSSGYDKQTNSTLAKTNPFLVKGGLSKCSDTHQMNAAAAGMVANINNNKNRFNSLKTLGIKKSPQFYSMRRCKRHHSYTGPNLLSVTATGMSASQNRISHLIDYDSSHPVYENLTDSIQIHEASQQTDGDPTLVRLSHDSDTNSSGNNGGTTSSSGGPTLYSTYSHKDRMSIHRSDSGISNSSYEYLPQPTPRGASTGSKSRGKHLQQQQQQQHQQPQQKTGVPVYMNLPFVACTANSLHPTTTRPFDANEPLSANDLADDLVYADVNDNENYGPINYKAASIYALVKKQKNGELKESKN